MDDIGEGVVFNSQTVVGYENTDGYEGVGAAIPAVADGLARCLCHTSLDPSRDVFAALPTTSTRIL